MLNQRTIAKAVHAIGVGVHSAEKVRLTLRPAEENSGIRFVRSDLPEKDPIQAHAENVSDTMLSTSIFTATMPGLYFFQWAIFSWGGQDALLKLTGLN